MSTGTLIGLAILVAAMLWLVRSYNGLVTARQRCRQAFADIDVQLKRRHDLVPKLVESLRGVHADDQGVLASLIEVRATALTAEGVTAQASAENALSGALGRLIAFVEANPDLKARPSFQRLKAELAAVEAGIVAAHRYFNDAADDYSAARGRIPALFYAAAMGFATPDAFALDAQATATAGPAPTARLAGRA